MTKKLVNRLRFDIIIAMSFRFHFLAHPVDWADKSTTRQSLRTCRRPARTQRTLSDKVWSGLPSGIQQLQLVSVCTASTYVSFTRLCCTCSRLHTSAGHFCDFKGYVIIYLTSLHAVTVGYKIGLFSQTSSERDVFHLICVLYNNSFERFAARRKSTSGCRRVNMNSKYQLTQAWRVDCTCTAIVQFNWDHASSPIYTSITYRTTWIKSWEADTNNNRDATTTTTVCSYLQPVMGKLIRFDSPNRIESNRFASPNRSHNFRLFTNRG